MKKINYPNDINHTYLSYFPTELLNNLQSQWDNLLLNYSQLKQLFPQDIRKILIADFDKLTDYFFNYKNITTDKDKIENELIEKTKSGKTKLKLFNYDAYSKYIHQFFCDNIKTMKLYSCFYCDISIIGKYKKQGKSDRLTVDIDHFYHKEQSPILALSLRNLIPACQVCNGRIKSSKNILEFYKLDKINNERKIKDILNRLSPTSELYDFNNNTLFEVIPGKVFTNNIEYLKNPQSFRIYIDSNSSYKHEIDAFVLEQRYNDILILLEALSILDLKQKFPLSKIQEIKRILNKHNYKISEEEIENIIFRFEFDEIKHSNLMKLKNDLLE